VPEICSLQGSQTDASFCLSCLNSSSTDACVSAVVATALMDSITTIPLVAIVIDGMKTTLTAVVMRCVSYNSYTCPQEPTVHTSQFST
jgi:hypothetical protein